MEASVFWEVILFWPLSSCILKFQLIVPSEISSGTQYCFISVASVMIEITIAQSQTVIIRETDFTPISNSTERSSRLFNVCFLSSSLLLMRKFQTQFPRERAEQMRNFWRNWSIELDKLSFFLFLEISFLWYKAVSVSGVNSLSRTLIFKHPVWKGTFFVPKKSSIRKMAFWGRFEPLNSQPPPFCVRAFCEVYCYK